MWTHGCFISMYDKIHYNIKNKKLKKKTFFFFQILALFLVALGLGGCEWAFCRWKEEELLFVVVQGLLIAVAPLVAEHGLWSTGSGIVAHRLGCSVACGTSQARDRTHVFCTGKQIPIHCTNRDVLKRLFLWFWRRWKTTTTTSLQGHYPIFRL